MATVLRFRSVWGIETGDNYDNWDKWFPTLKAQGYCMSPYLAIETSQANSPLFVLQLVLRSTFISLKTCLKFENLPTSTGLRLVCCECRR